jgi:sec-independent protein translocase protein TatB
LVVLFLIALIIFGPQKLPELARLLGKATAEFRKMTNDFRYALEDEVRELDRQNRIREQEAAMAATRAAQPPAPEVPALPPPENTVAREIPETVVTATVEPPSEASAPPHADSPAPEQPAAEAVSIPQEKPSDEHHAA